MKSITFYILHLSQPKVVTLNEKKLEQSLSKGSKKVHRIVLTQVEFVSMIKRIEWAPTQRVDVDKFEWTSALGNKEIIRWESASEHSKKTLRLSSGSRGDEGGHYVHRIGLETTGSSSSEGVTQVVGSCTATDVGAAWHPETKKPKVVWRAVHGRRRQWPGAADLLPHRSYLRGATCCLLRRFRALLIAVRVPP